MRRYLFLLAIALILLSLIFISSRHSPQPKPTQADSSFGNLKIVISDFGSDQGVVKVGLASTKEAFEARKSVKEGFTGVTLDIKDKRTEHTFENIPYGEYAIKYYHDENGNGKLDANALGIPNEPYGFSNNARAVFSPPSFEKAKFVFDNDEMVHAMKMGKAGS